jgi:hypothetical protein
MLRSRSFTRDHPRIQSMTFSRPCGSMPRMLPSFGRRRRRFEPSSSLFSAVTPRAIGSIRSDRSQTQPSQCGVMATAEGRKPEASGAEQCPHGVHGRRAPSLGEDAASYPIMISVRFAGRMTLAEKLSESTPWSAHRNRRARKRMMRGYRFHCAVTMERANTRSKDTTCSSLMLQAIYVADRRRRNCALRRIGHFCGSLG